MREASRGLGPEVMATCMSLILWDMSLCGNGEKLPMISCLLSSALNEAREA